MEEFDFNKYDKIPLKDLSSNHVGKIVLIEVIPSKREEIRTKVISCDFECPSCGSILSKKQKYTKITYPNCPCGRKKDFKLTSQEKEDFITMDVFGDSGQTKKKINFPDKFIEILKEIHSDEIQNITLEILGKVIEEGKETDLVKTYNVDPISLKINKEEIERIPLTGKSLSKKNMQLIMNLMEDLSGGKSIPVSIEDIKKRIGLNKMELNEGFEYLNAEGFIWQVKPGYYKIT